jgi:2-polyprenyl-3-methyl-5-hydroxy-6-metoxy-1,4-benzoquinol methylase
MVAPPEPVAYAEKEAAYFGFARYDLAHFVPSNPPGRVLEIGAGDGSTLVELKRSGRAREAVGVELMSLHDGRQRRPEIDRFIFADVEQRSLDLTPESFDVLICGDVLEHLRDPWAILSYLTGFLRAGGTFLISLPNIRYWRAFRAILLGDFRYASSGVLDRTHLRFFCKKNMIDMVRAAGLHISRIEPSFMRQHELRLDRLLNGATLGVLEPFFAQQYLIVAQKSPQGHGAAPSGHGA